MTSARTEQPPVPPHRLGKQRLRKVLLEDPIKHDFATDVWTLSRVHKLAHDEFGVSLSESQISRVLRKMGFSAQRSTKRTLKLTPGAVRDWKARRWPVPKKTLENSGV